MRASATTRTGPVERRCRAARTRPRSLQHSHNYWRDSRGPFNSITDKLTATTTDYAYSAGDHPHATTQVGSDTYEYNGAGMLKKRTIDSAASDLTWDHTGRLQSVSPPSPAVATTFDYDAGGQRLTRRDADGKVTLYLPGQEISRTSGGTTSGVRYYASGASTVAVRKVGATDAGLYRLAGDQHGSHTVAVNSAGGPVIRQRYLPFGAPRGATNQLPTERGFLGQTEDDDTGLVYLNARYYDPTIGQFISPDPVTIIESPRTLNHYAYAGDNPSSFSDPSGLLCVDQADCNHNNDSDWGDSNGSSSGTSSSELEAAESMSPRERERVLREFFHFNDPIAMFMGRGGEGAGLWEFKKWEISSGRIGGSRWWSAVNGLLVMDIAKAQRLIERDGTSARSNDTAVQLWLEYAAGLPGARSTQDALWKAHQYSLHSAIDKADRLMLDEPIAEQEFIEEVIENVDATVFAGIGTDPLSAIGMNAFLGMVYPTYYPERSDAGSHSVVRLMSSQWGESNALTRFGLVGVHSSAFWYSWATS